MWGVPCLNRRRMAGSAGGEQQKCVHSLAPDLLSLEQAAFLSYALGGTQGYEGNGNMTAAHQRLVNDMGMRMEHFDIVLEHLGASLQDLKVPPVCMATRVHPCLSYTSNPPQITCPGPCWDYSCSLQDYSTPHILDNACPMHGHE